MFTNDQSQPNLQEIQQVMIMENKLTINYAFTLNSLPAWTFMLMF